MPLGLSEICIAWTKFFDGIEVEFWSTLLQRTGVVGRQAPQRLLRDRSPRLTYHRSKRALRVKHRKGQLQLWIFGEKI